MTLYRLVKTSRFESWLSKLKDLKGKARILYNIDKIARHGYTVCDWKQPVKGVYEVRIHYGPGYRLYLSVEGSELILLLIGGDKGTQKRDIAEAEKLMREWRSQSGGNE